MAATNSTHTPTNVKHRSTSSISSDVLNPAKNAEPAYIRMLQVSTRRRPNQSVR
ncbi:MAG: hypothetical protein K8T25_10175 [Planctomycetia bacterium]|nr:hypothetical protein [Planctomycetia bacterium]